MRTHNPNGGADAISIMHPADTTRSDLDLAGIMIRCSESGAEVVIVILPALPFRVRPHVTFGKPGNAIKFEATVAPPGTVVLLPKEAIALVMARGKPWRIFLSRLTMTNPQFVALLRSRAWEKLSNI